MGIELKYRSESAHGAEVVDPVQSAPSGQFQCSVKSFCGSYTGRWANVTAAG